MLGGTTVEVTRLSLGGGSLGNLFHEIKDSDAEATVEAAWECGIRYFDTAPFYGLGLAESRLGAGLRGKPRSEFVVSTKVGRLLGGADGWHWDFTADGVKRSLSSSLDRLGLDRIDVVYLHDPDDHIEEALATAYPALDELRSQGVIGAVGAGVNGCAVAQPFVERAELDCVLLAGRYTLLDRSAEDFLQLCLARRVSVVAGGVFNTGLLTNPDSPDVHFDYGPVPEDIRTRARGLAATCARFGVPLTAAALQFPARHPAVASVVVGCASPAQVRANAASFAMALPDALWEQLS